MTDSRSLRASQRPSSQKRIVAAAYLCFERRGIESTRIEDIAREAGVTRPTVYRYFKRGKIDIVDLISAEESRKIHEEVNRRLIRGQAFEDLVVETLVLVVRIAIQNRFVRRIVSFHEFRADSDSVAGEMNRLHRQWWSPLMEQAAQRGEIADDLDLEEILNWLMLVQRMLLMRLQSGPIDDAQLRRLIRRFVVEPLLAWSRSRS